MLFELRLFKDILRIRFCSKSTRTGVSFYLRLANGSNYSCVAKLN
jgi:hypothetical protein